MPSRADFYADFRSRRFPKEKRHTSDVQKTLDAMTIETKKTLEVGAAEETARAAERKKKKAFRLENDDPGTKKRARKAKKKKSWKKKRWWKKRWKKKSR